MMTKRWETIIDALSVIKPECANMEKIRLMLDYDPTADAQVLDNLYMLKLIPIEEYKERMEKHIKNLKSSLMFAEERVKDASEMGENFDPMVYYALAFSGRGTAVENALNEDFLKKFSNVE